MNKIARTILITAILAAIYVLMGGIGWADVFFWKTQGIALTCDIIQRILAPVDLLPIAPGSRVDTPWFFIPMIGFAFLLWATIIRIVIDKNRKRNSTEPAA